MASGGGCGCKLPPDALRRLLQSSGGLAAAAQKRLLVGAQTSDDAAVWKISDKQAALATADFFAPMVDNAKDFGGIAAANALSDIYAMGGKPLFALALLAAPAGKLPEQTLANILAGGRAVCARAGVAVAGGHSINAAEPLYGLAVFGEANPRRLLTNAGARPGDALLLGKPLGVGVMAGAIRRRALPARDYAAFVAHATQLNAAGAQLAKLPAARAMTDVTGFGLLGHLAEICRASNCAAVVRAAAVPLLPAARRLLREGAKNGAMERNRRALHGFVGFARGVADWRQRALYDAQTSGGLLLCCRPAAVARAKQIFAAHGQKAAQIGEIVTGAPAISVA